MKAGIRLKGRIRRIGKLVIILVGLCLLAYLGENSLTQEESTEPLDYSEDREGLMEEEERTENESENCESTDGETSDAESDEYISIAISTTDFTSLYHERVELYAAADCRLIFINSQNQKETAWLQAGETLLVESSSAYLESGDLQIRPEQSVMTLLSVRRAQGNPAYRGILTLKKQPEGIAIINTLPLEEYLYGVVPSEMPAAYPAEALQAQAVSARTYASRHLQQTVLNEENELWSKLGAQMDDSVKFQVYQNLPENEVANQAVQATAGEVLWQEGEPADIYYYSTSCGYNKENAENTDFEKYILEKNTTDLEKEEAWYRWEYQVEEIEYEEIEERLKEKQQEKPELVLTKNKLGYYIEKRIDKIGKITDLSCKKREENGRVTELEISTTLGTYLVLSENAIRYILNQPSAQIIRNDDSILQAGSLIPSAFFIINTDKAGEAVVGYTIFGGGYGHGNGMSQNGAKAMAESGYSYQEILAAYYPDCEFVKE